MRKENYCDGDGGGGEETAPFWINLIPFHIYGACDPTIFRIATKHVWKCCDPTIFRIAKKHGWKCLASTYSLPTPASGEASRTLK